MLDSPPKTLSAAEKRANLRHSTLAGIASSREVQSGGSNIATRIPSTPARRVQVVDRSLPVQAWCVTTCRPIRALALAHTIHSNVATSSSKTKPPLPSTKAAAHSDAFSLSWHKKLQQKVREGGTLSTPVRQAPRTRKAPATEATTEGKPEVLEGPCDEDVEAGRDVVIAAAASGARARAKQVRPACSPSYTIIIPTPTILPSSALS